MSVSLHSTYQVSHLIIICAFQNGCTPLHYAVLPFTTSSQCRVEVVRLLLDKGAEIDDMDKVSEQQPGQLGLHNANVVFYHNLHRNRISKTSLSFDIFICIRILNKVILWNFHSLTAQDGHAPIHFASSEPYEEVVRLLLDRGANLEIRNCVSKWE